MESYLQQQTIMDHASNYKRLERLFMTCIEYLRKKLEELNESADEIKQLDLDLKTAQKFRKMILHNLEVD